MFKKRERFAALKDKTQQHRNSIVYTVMALALVGAMIGWGLLPDMVSMNPDLPEPYFHPKERLLLVNVAMTSVFSGLFWWRPRELCYLFCSLVGLVMTGTLLYANLGV